MFKIADSYQLTAVSWYSSMRAGVYLHIPFCKSRCSYCDFATDVYKSSEVVDRYVDALTAEILAFQHEKNPPADAGGSDVHRDVDTIYFGGGTPSMLAPNQVEKILNAVEAKFSFGRHSEVTMEMNPATVTLESLKEYRSLGVNRASFGVQTFDDTELKRLARGHNADDARMTFRLLRDAGF
ncbi:MAG TPA: radical SAM protein, partial [Pyrinomonadaceae bacterium]|nr:radical SAM protein [Pyrinomonadaceae bacterium]